MNKKNNPSKPWRKSFQELTFTDDFMFRKVLRTNADLCKRLVELLLDVSIDHIKYIDEEHVIQDSTESKSIRLDVYLKDEEGTVFDLEMQNLRESDLPKRARYYQSLIDVEHLAVGIKYQELPDSYIVFLCTFDPFEKDYHKYEFRELCTDDPSVELNSGASKVFINAKSDQTDISSEMRAFLDYLCGMEPKSDLTMDIAAMVTRVKANEHYRREYMFFGEILDDAKEEGREEGRAEGRFESVDRLVAEGTFSEEKACDVLGVDIDKYREYIGAQEQED